jgi:GNAT superfamily N-acetyltransferase
MFTIRKITAADKEIFINMMRKFYTSPSVITNGSEKIFEDNFKNCNGGSNFVEGFIFCVEDKIIGYGILAKSYSTEFGGECIWIEDIYIESEYRRCGYGSRFIEFVKKNFPDKILRLESEKVNSNALELYKKFGFKELPYLELVRISNGKF